MILILYYFVNKIDEQILIYKFLLVSLKKSAIYLRLNLIFFGLDNNTPSLKIKKLAIFTFHLFMTYIWFLLICRYPHLTSF